MVTIRNQCERDLIVGFVEHLWARHVWDQKKPLEEQISLKGFLKAKTKGYLEEEDIQAILKEYFSEEE